MEPEPKLNTEKEKFQSGEVTFPEIRFTTRLRKRYSLSLSLPLSLSESLPLSVQIVYCVTLSLSSKLV
jgi:hypothetical protein